PDLLVRAFKWVVADRDAEGGWRPLRWNDLPNLVDGRHLQVSLPATWGGWVIDLDDLDPSVRPGAIPAAWNGKHSSFIRKQAAKPAVRKNLARADAAEALERLLDWHTWTVDQIELQLNNGEVRRVLRKSHNADYARLEELFGALEQLAE